ncbi:hypothetical protein ACFSTE_09010 [Aquimarina hainanensis]|uniref:Uncharacterized protein n=1 Tax=Aquimarina hainanensis TaxID=1578017 RepID=A0ABW5N6T1_9FLAO|nr:hypothetical protein [Aquimarina sp. TRL1]QKX03872.1 hypothetical protein HN014_02775 [Aquimarina sp. TRL1]
MIFVIRPVSQFSGMVYYQLNIDEIIEKYCVNKERPMLRCNGKCHLSKQMNFSLQNKGRTGEKIVRIAESFIPVYYENLHVTIKELQIPFYSKTNWRWEEIHFMEVYYPIDHPPRFV